MAAAPHRDIRRAFDCHEVRADDLGCRQEREGHALSALMLTDILAKGTDLLVAGDTAAVERAFGQPSEDGVLDLPGVMSRKKQVAPKLMAATAR